LGGLKNHLSWIVSGKEEGGGGGGGAIN